MRSSFSRSLAAVIVLLVCTDADPASASQLVRKIPFSDWLSAQTAVVGWQARSGPQVNPPVLGNIAFVDYAGLRAQQSGLSFGFSASGSVTVRELPDGSGEVAVSASFTNAITWARDAGNVPIFGFTPGQLGADPSLSPGLSSGHLQLKYIVPDPAFPELSFAEVAFNGAGTIETGAFSSAGRGPLRAGFGVAEGSPGTCGISQVQLLTTGGGATADGYPVEHVDVRATGGAALTAGPASASMSATPGTSGQGSVVSESWGALKGRFRNPQSAR